MTEDDKVAAVDKVLGEPWLAELSEDALKVRRNLLVASFISIGGTVAGVRIAADSPIFGFHLQNLTDDLLRSGMAITVGYLLLHFVWYAFDSFMGWRVRITGTRQAFITAGTFGDENLDYTGDLRQSSLYNWWKGKRQYFGSLKGRMPAIEASVSDLRRTIESLQSGGDIIQNSTAVTDALASVEGRMVELRHAIENAERQDSSPRILASLNRFDRWFSLWLRSQNLRWLVIDVLVPLVAGSVAVILLLCHRV
ncbi:hypothetical protein SAMN04487785_102265 [Dyella jiangningensis]|uniref:hypothetical protein n=1 Tax=Dyella sp. AtDHG13 TaxID=1938897 RepID=UPI00088E40CD|nr:hypothetical protein [Dyella sp. AtDHG13]PXV60543.1 hypothetical protein BDW41_102265 [Dyella sp. AtDHG13]SDJ49571.1 hypothetical protein SAMN04487785_102265 [Dyella jiangningensis]